MVSTLFLTIDSVIGRYQEPDGYVTSDVHHD